MSPAPGRPPSAPEPSAPHRAAPALAGAGLAGADLAGAPVPPALVAPPDPERGPAGPGWVRLDCHLHTVASGDAVTTLAELAERVAALRLDVVCITDHHEISAALSAVERGIGARVIVGEEIRTPDGDVIGLFLTDRVPYVLPLARAVGRIRAQGGLVYAPHPFDPGRSSLGTALAPLCASGLVDAIEVVNAKVADPAHNQQAAGLAARFGLPGGAGSDAHDPAGIGAAYAELPDFDGPASFLDALHRARLFGEYRPHAPRYAARPADSQPDLLRSRNIRSRTGPE